MDYTFHITVHVYAGEKLNDSVLVPHNKNYGIVGKDIIAPLRRINNKECRIENVENSFTVKELWNRIEYKIFGNSKRFDGESTFEFVQRHNIVKKYLLVDNLRYRIEEINKPLKYYLNKMEIPKTEKINIQLLISANAGAVFEEDGIRYYMYSRESGQHNVPHVHVDVRHETSGSFSLIDGSQLAGEKIKSKDVKKIKNMIESKKEDLIKYWNEHTDGLTVDLNQALGLIHY